MMIEAQTSEGAGLWCGNCERELAPEDVCNENCAKCGEPYDEFTIIDCGECEGTGVIEWHEGPHLKSETCPKCEGHKRLRDTPHSATPYDEEGAA